MGRRWSAVLAAGLMGGLAIRGHGAGPRPPDPPDRPETAIRGIDVSHHLGKIDWRAVAKEGYRFAYIKATEGGGHRDPAFRRNWAAAKAGGLSRGAYHFFTFCKPGAAQAANFIEAVPEDAEALPPVIDFEFLGNCKERPPREAVLRELTEFSDLVRRKYRKDPVLYVTEESYARYLAGQGHGYRLWMRGVLRRPGPVEGRPWTLWQQADDARVSGIRRPVDQDLFNGGEEEFIVFVGSSAAPGPLPEGSGAP